MKLQRSVGYQFRVKLADSTGCQISRIGEFWKSLFFPPGIKFLELLLIHHYFTAYLGTSGEETGRFLGMSQAQGNGLDSTDVGRNVFANCAITTGNTLSQHAAFIDQSASQTVHFQIDKIIKLSRVC